MLYYYTLKLAETPWYPTPLHLNLLLLLLLPHCPGQATTPMQTQLQLGRSSAAGCSFRWSNAAPAAAAGQPRHRALQRQPLLVSSKFGGLGDMFGGNKGGDQDAARRAIEVGGVWAVLRWRLLACWLELVLTAWAW